MDLIVLRSLATVASFLVFAGIVWWAYGGSQAGNFSEAERIPFEEDDLPSARRDAANDPQGGRA